MALSSEDELAILRLVNKYAHATSSRDLEGLCALFAEDGVWERIEGASTGKYNEKVRVQGPAEFRQVAIKSFEMAGETPYQYVAVNPVIEGDGDTAEGQVTLVIYGIEPQGVSVIMIGNFIDRYRKTADGWKFAYRGMLPST